MSMAKAKRSFIVTREVKSSTLARKKNDVSRNGNSRTVSIPSNRDRNWTPAKSQQSLSERITSETRHLNCHKSAQTPSYVHSDTRHPNRRRSVQTAPSCVHYDITKDEVQDIKKLFDALAVFKRTNIQEIKQTMKTESSEQKIEISRLKKHIDLMYEESTLLKEELGKKEEQLLQLNLGRYWNVEHDQLEQRHRDLRRNYDKMKYESQDKTNFENEIETLRSKLMKTEREFSQQNCDMFILQKRIETLNQEARSLKEQLYQNNMQKQKQTQGSSCSVEHERVDLRHRDIQRKYDKIKHESEAMVMEKSKLENEIETLRSKLKRTEHELSDKTNEMSRLKKQVALKNEESNILKVQLQEKDKHIVNKTQGKHWNVDKEELKKMEYDFKRKLEKINGECQLMTKEKATLESEVDTIRIKLRKTEQELSEKTNEISGLKARVQSMEDESKSLKAQLQEKDMLLLKQNHAQNCNWEFEQLDIRHRDLQGKFDKMKDEYRAMEMDKCSLENINENLRAVLKKTKQELSEQTSDASKLKQHYESTNQKSESLKMQLQEKDMLLLKQNQDRNRIAEYKQLELRHNDLQRQFNKIEYESQAMAMDKIKLQNENEKVRSMLQKTKEEFSQQMAEMTRIKKHAESVVEESKYLHAQLTEKERQQLQQNQGRNLNVEYEQLEIKHSDLQRKFDQIHDEARALMVDKTKLENENEKVRSMLQKTEQEFSQQMAEMARLKKHVESVTGNSESLKSQLQEKERQQLKQNQGLNLNVEYEQLVKRHSDLQRKFDKTEDEARTLMVDKTAIENENKKLSSILRKTEQESSEQKNEISKLKKRFENMDRELESSKAHLQQTERQLQEQILATMKANAEKDDALTRLSRLMGQQMSEGNPNITDLSDQNRPSKLGERYSELYDNEWTNAFEVLTDNIGKDDKEAIDVLRTILLESYTRALDFSISQLKEAESKLSGSTKAVGNECKRLLKEARKHINIKDADSLLENVLEVILSKVVDRRQIRETTLRIYTKECFQLCWFMSIQDPPVVLVEDPTKGSRFDTNIYKHYINSGDTVDYVVWPALLLHKGGPLLTKGVAQPLVRSRSE